MGRAAELVVGAAGLIAAACSDQADRDQSARISLAVTGVTVVDVLAADPARALRPNQSVLVDGRRITAVGPIPVGSLARTARVIDGRGKYLLPGLSDAHTHITGLGDSLAGLPLLYVANGVTLARDLGYQLPASETSGPSPRIFAAGPVVESGWWIDEALRSLAREPDVADPMVFFRGRFARYRLDGPGDAEMAIESLVRLGSALIKFRFLRGEEVRSLLGAARGRGVAVVGHAPHEVSIGEAADSGIRSMEHAETVTENLGEAAESLRRAQFERLAWNGTAITPTLVMNVGFRLTPASVAAAVIDHTANRIDRRGRYLPRGFIELWRVALRDQRDAAATDWTAFHRRQISDLRLARSVGVKLLAGADAGDLLVYPGWGLHEELELLVREVGLTPLEALQSATIHVAESLGATDTIGLIAPGKVADLVLLDANPVADIRNTTRIRAVVLDGRALTRSDLDGLLARAESLARASWGKR